MTTQKCPLLTAKKYQRGFEAGLLFTGFRNNEIFWLGDDKEWNKMDEQKELLDDKLRAEYQAECQDDMGDELDQII